MSKAFRVAFGDPEFLDETAYWTRQKTLRDSARTYESMKGFELPRSRG
jgi:hypothetical protein